MDLTNFQRKAVLLIFISILIGGILLARKEPLKIHEITEPRRSAPTTKALPIPTRIDINTADISSIMQLPGIGPVLAKEIINHRPYSTIDDLLKVPGIGEKRLSKIKELINLPEAVDVQGRASHILDVQGRASHILIDLNTTTIEQLTFVPGIGLKLAQSIINYRKEHGGFKNLEELMCVPKIGQKTYERLKEYLYVGMSEDEPSTSVRTYDSMIDPKVKCPYCGKQLWEKGKRKQRYIRCPHCLRLLDE